MKRTIFLIHTGTLSKLFFTRTLSVRELGRNSLKSHDFSAVGWWSLRSLGGVIIEFGYHQYLD